MRLLHDSSTCPRARSCITHSVWALVRLKRPEAALVELEQATLLDPANARFSYVYAVALHSTGKVEAAIVRLKQTLLSNPNDPHILQALVSFHAGRGDSAEAGKYAERLRAFRANLSEK
jgi:predicted Zn-dependent protease